MWIKSEDDRWAVNLLSVLFQRLNDARVTSMHSVKVADSNGTVTQFAG